MNPDLLEKYLYSRGLLDPKLATKIILGGKEIIVGEEILNDTDLLEKAAGIWEANKQVIEAILRARIMPIVVELVMKCDPREVTVLRQCLLELTGIVDDFEKYSQEYTRRKSAIDKGKEGEENQTLA
jgi:hypothetical protein